MANLADCIQRAIDAGEVEQQRGLAVQTEYDQLVQRYVQIMPLRQAEATAAAHLKEATKRAARSRRHMVLNQLQTMVRIKHLVESAPDPATAVRNLVEYSVGSGFQGESIEKLADAMVNSVNAGLNDVLRKVGLNVVGESRNKALLTDIMRELHLQDSGNVEAKALADAIRTQQQRLRKSFNAHGGDIGDLADFGVSHSHDANALRKAGFDNWAAGIRDRLDWSRIEDASTGRPFAVAGSAPSVADANVFLRKIYKNIVSRGWNSREASMTVGGKALYNRRADHRQLHFKDADAWLDYNRDFGTSDPFSAMIGGLHGLARDIAQMRVLGPNPKMGLEYASQIATKHAHDLGDAGLVDRVAKQTSLAKTMLMHFDGSVNHTAYHASAGFFSGVRKVLTSIQLGSAPLSAVTDLATISVASNIAGMGASRVLSRQMKLMANHATRETAGRMGYVAETLASAGATAARWTGDTIAPELAERVSGFTMRASGLSYWTDMARTAFRMEFSGFMADNAGRNFAAIDAPLRKIFEDRGITSRDWDLLRDDAHLFRTDAGDTFLSPTHWLNSQATLSTAEAEGLAMRVQMAIEEQLELAIPTATLEGRARLVGNTDPGTAGGILLRSTMMYKSFALSLTLNQYRRFVSLPTPMAKAQYAATMSAGLLMLGATAVQLKEMAKGRDPRPMDEAKFWLAATFQGGGLGIFGDFFSAETSRAGGGLAQTAAGPVVGFASDILNPIASNATRALRGEKTYVGRDAANFVRYNTPVMSSLWYSRLAYDRLVADTLQSFLDPEAEMTWRRQERQRAKEYGTQTFWPRGAAVPNRGPNLSNILGANQ